MEPADTLESELDDIPNADLEASLSSMTDPKNDADTVQESTPPLYKNRRSRMERQLVK